MGQRVAELNQEVAVLQEQRKAAEVRYRGAVAARMQNPGQQGHSTAAIEAKRALDEIDFEVEVLTGLLDEAIAYDRSDERKAQLAAAREKLAMLAASHAERAKHAAAIDKAVAALGVAVKAYCDVQDGQVRAVAEIGRDVLTAQEMPDAERRFGLIRGPIDSARMGTANIGNALASLLHAALEPLARAGSLDAHIRFAYVTPSGETIRVVDADKEASDITARAINAFAARLLDAEAAK
jgi:hypothetical protein